jgi:tRNA A37 threonylcarbamoyladenosine synthetase subunit TsaC/SUA5/YrdC
MQTGTAPCRSCRSVAEDCSLCGGRSAIALGGAASLRGRLWAEEVVRRLLERWPARWPRTTTMLEKAAQRVEDLARNNQTLRAYLVRVCVSGAAERYDELVGYLAGRSLNLPGDPPVRPADEYDTPE